MHYVFDKQQIRRKNYVLKTGRKYELAGFLESDFQ